MVTAFLIFFALVLEYVYDPISNMKDTAVIDTSFLKFNYSGIGNKTLAVQTNGFNSSSSGYGGNASTIPFQSFKIDVASSSKLKGLNQTVITI